MRTDIGDFMYWLDGALDRCRRRGFVIAEQRTRNVRKHAAGKRPGRVAVRRAEIRELAKGTLTHAEIAARLGCSRQLVTAVLAGSAGRSWADALGLRA